jgi:D-sedoheptulose 7-phosphate isomerase
MSEFYVNYFEEAARTLSGLTTSAENISQITKQIISRIERGGKVFWFGNGGSASDAQHLSAELMGRFAVNRKAIPSIALNTDTSAITAITKVFRYESIFQMQLEGLCNPVDVCIGISTSGKSQNVILGLNKSREIGALTILMTGSNATALEKFADHVIGVNSSQTCHIQEAHITIGQAICAEIEAAFANA